MNRILTGPGAIRVALMLERDGYACVPQQTCKRRQPQILVPGHRINRGMGGSSHADRHALSRLITNCAGCNGWLEDNPAEAYASGWKIRHGITAASVIPVLYPDGLSYLLDDDGGRNPTRAPWADRDEPVTFTAPCACGAETEWEAKQRPGQCAGSRTWPDCDCPGTVIPQPRSTP